MKSSDCASSSQKTDGKGRRTLERKMSVLASYAMKRKGIDVLFYVNERESDP